YLTFHGRWRGPIDAWKHVHESAPTMVAPLIILAVPTALAGLFLGLPFAPGAAGIWLAYRWYVRDPEAPARFVAGIPFGLGPGMYAASVNKYYVDDLYGLVWARGGVLVGNLMWWFDAKVIDGAVNGAGWIAQRLGAVLRRSQTGRVQNYGLGMGGGLVV